MKFLANLAFGALTLGVAAMGAAQPANATTSFNISYGYGGPPTAVHYNPCYRPYYARPRHCRYPLYRGRVFMGDAWHHGPFRYRDYGGYRQYWHGGRWRRGSLHAGPRVRRNFNRGYGRGYRRGYRRGRR